MPANDGSVRVDIIVNATAARTQVLQFQRQITDLKAKLRTVHGAAFDAVAAKVARTQTALSSARIAVSQFDSQLRTAQTGVQGFRTSAERMAENLFRIRRLFTATIGFAALGFYINEWGKIADAILNARQHADDLSTSIQNDATSAYSLLTNTQLVNEKLQHEVDVLEKKVDPNAIKIALDEAYQSATQLGEKIDGIMQKAEKALPGAFSLGESPLGYLIRGLRGTSLPDQFSKARMEAARATAQMALLTSEHQGGTPKFIEAEKARVTALRDEANAINSVLNATRLVSSVGGISYTEFKVQDQQKRMDLETLRDTLLATANATEASMKTPELKKHVAILQERNRAEKDHKQHLHEASYHYGSVDFSRTPGMQMVKAETAELEKANRSREEMTLQHIKSFIEGQRLEARAKRDALSATERSTDMQISIIRAKSEVGLTGPGASEAQKLSAAKALHDSESMLMEKQIAFDKSMGAAGADDYQRDIDRKLQMDYQYEAERNRIMEASASKIQAEQDRETAEIQRALMTRHGLYNFFATQVNSIILRMIEAEIAQNTRLKNFTIMSEEQKLAVKAATEARSLAIDVASSAAHIAIALKEKFVYAGKGAAKAASEYPFPVNIAVGAGTFAALMAFKRGGIVPETSMAMVHRNEMVLPAHIASFVTRAASSDRAGTGGGSGGVHLHYSPTVQAIDTAGAAEFFEQHAEFAAAALHRYARGKNLT